MITLVAFELLVAAFLACQPYECARAEGGYQAGEMLRHVSDENELVAFNVRGKAYRGSLCLFVALEKPEWWQVIVAAIGIAVIAWQAVLTRRSVRVGETSAEALINSERAWVLVDTGEVNDNFEANPNALEFFELRPVVRNYGRTPAQIIRTSIRSQQVADASGELPLEPQFGPTREVDIIIPPDVVIQPLRTTIPLSDFTDIRQGVRVLYVFGFIDYISFGRERQTRFCIMYRIPRGFEPAERGFYLAVQVPPAYMRCT